MSESKYVSPLPHHLGNGPLVEVFPDIFVVRGSASFGDSGPMSFISVPRNMIVLREGGELTLINSLRLTTSSEKELVALGKIVNVVKLGHWHGRDDLYYVKRYSAQHWAVTGADTKRFGLDTPHKLLTEGASLPVQDTRVFVFTPTLTNFPEACILVNRHGGVVISCDSLQNFGGPFDGYSTVGRLMLTFYDFFHPGNVGPFWLKILLSKGCKLDEMEAEFNRLLASGWKHLLPGHGHPLKDRAGELAVERVKITFNKLRNPSKRPWVSYAVVGVAIVGALGWFKTRV